jgi:hypothetical protein
MGRSTRKIDPLVSPPRNVWDHSGQLIGTFFPMSQIIRLLDGQILHMDAHNRVTKSNGATAILDLNTLVINQVDFDVEN